MSTTSVIPEATAESVLAAIYDELTGDACLAALLEERTAARSGLDTGLLRAALAEIGAWKAAETGAERRRAPEVLAKHLHDGLVASSP